LRCNRIIPLVPSPRSRSRPLAPVSPAAETILRGRAKDRASVLRRKSTKVDISRVLTLAENHSVIASDSLVPPIFNYSDATARSESERGRKILDAVSSDGLSLSFLARAQYDHRYNACRQKMLRKLMQRTGGGGGGGGGGGTLARKSRKRRRSCDKFFTTRSCNRNDFIVHPRAKTKRARICARRRAARFMRVHPPLPHLPPPLPRLYLLF